MAYPAHINLALPCWITTGLTNAQGYGLVSFGGMQLKHRVSYALYLGPVDGWWVLHACDEPACWNPAHLFLGDHQANVDDMRSKGRHPHGVTHGSAKLTDADVREIRSAPPRQGMKLARKFGVTRNIIYAIRSGRTWKHVT